MICLISTVAYGQNDVQFTHFMFNKMGYNPSFAGFDEALTVGAIYREQWLNIEGAPRTINAHAHTPFANSRNGIGLSLTSDQIGMFQTNAVDLAYAYRMPFGKNKLSIGINGRLEHAVANWNLAEGVDPGDVMLPGNEQTIILPNFGVGFNYASDNYYFGASVAQLLNNSYYQFSDVPNENDMMMRTLYLMGGAEFGISKNVKFVPTALVSYNPNAPVDFDLNLGFLFMERFYAALNYRLSDSFDLMLMYQLTPQFRMGAAYDFTVSELAGKTPGSFEFMGSYTFDFEDENIRNIRFF